MRKVKREKREKSSKPKKEKLEYIIKPAYCKISYYTCGICGKLFVYNKFRKYCGKCDKSRYFDYKKSCKFDFSLKNYPNEFDFDLIRKHGWYKAANNGNNLYGVSRDHMISVDYGWQNNISPDIISHPANCMLMIHSENVSKNNRCILTLQELLERIEWWEEKYNR